jgi:hypothetical protein
VIAVGPESVRGASTLGGKLAYAAPVLRLRGLVALGGVAVEWA